MADTKVGSVGARLKIGKSETDPNLDVKDDAEGIEYYVIIPPTPSRYLVSISVIFWDECHSSKKII